MKINSCRKCRNGMTVYETCHVYKNPIEFVCHKCNINTDKEIHSNCMVKETAVMVQ